MHLGEISLECSRPGASAVALWATQQLFPLVQGGEFAANLDKNLQAARDFHARLDASGAFVPLMEPELDIVVYTTAGPDASASSKRTRRIFERAAAHDLHLAMIELPVELVQRYAPAMAANADTITCLRSVLMKPEHGDWLDAIMDILERSAKF